MAPTMGFASSGRLSRSSSTPNLAARGARENGASGKLQRADGSPGKGFDMSPHGDSDVDTASRNKESSKGFTIFQPSKRRPIANNSEKQQQQQPPQSQPNHRRTGSLIDKSRQWFPMSSKSSKESPTLRQETYSIQQTPDDHNLGSVGRTKTKTEALASLAKLSWLPSSSPPPPNSPSAKDRDPSSKPVGSRRPALMAEQRAAAAKRWSEPTKSAPKPLARASSYFSKMKTKQPLAEVPTEMDSRSDSSTASYGTPTMGSQAVFSHKSVPDDSTMTPITDESFMELTVQQTDPLWPAFKSMDMDYSVFVTKSASQKVVLVKNSFLPFLRNTADHWSTKRLHPEDLDRRTRVLSLWWDEMLDMLEGTAVLKVDRPVLYEALTAIMMRLEWRLTTPHFLSSADRNLRDTLRSDSWGKGLPPSTDRDAPQTIVEAAEKSVRENFISNLVKQVVFAVEKTSIRYAPLPLITFSGKTCAYAFFFIPGFAEILVRQWNISQHQLKRTADELGIPSMVPKAGRVDFTLFPPALLSLQWTSPRSMFSMLRRQPQTPAMMPTLSWTGHWMARWKGLDSDLFFVFCKYFHILSDDFMPSGLSMAEKAQSPGFVSIQAQLLLSLDRTLHRQSAEAAAAKAPCSPQKGPTLLDQVPGSDATASALSFQASEMGNTPKDMSESAVIILLKGVLFDSTPDQKGARHTFAEAFARLMAGAVRKTSLYDSHACFTVCDFLEEFMAIYDEFAWTKGPGGYSDWSFWLDVFKKMLLSLNTVTEVRVLCFIFTIWRIVARDPERKAALCIDWLLSEEVFNSFYSHWCPLVRGYYHRLLCWRICRCDGEPSELDL